MVTGKILARAIIIVFLSSGVIIWGAEPTAYVLNTNGESLSKISLETGVFENDILTIGSDVFSYPNQLYIRDTLMFAVASGTSEIQLINLNTENIIDLIDVGAGSNPYWLDIYDGQYLYVTKMLTNSIAKVDYIDGTIVAEETIGKSPSGVKIIGDEVFAACSGFDFGTYMYDPGMVYVYDIVGDTIKDSISVALNPQYMALDGENRLHVVCTGDYGSVTGRVYIIDPSIHSVVDSVLVGGTPGQIAIGPDGVAYIAAAGWSQDGYVYSYDALTGEIYHDSNNPITVDLNCITVNAFQDSMIYSGSFTNFVNVIDSSGTYFDSYAVGDGPIDVAFNYKPGDVNGDFEVNLLDVTYKINWLYKDSYPPVWPKWRANVNADGGYNLLDITYLINYLYKEGSRPVQGPDWVN